MLTDSSFLNINEDKYPMKLQIDSDSSLSKNGGSNKIQTNKNLPKNDLLFVPGYASPK